MRNQAALVILTIASLCAAQEATPGAATKTYHSDAYNFDLMYPANFASSKTAVDDTHTTRIASPFPSSLRT